MFDSDKKNIDNFKKAVKSVGWNIEDRELSSVDKLLMKNRQGAIKRFYVNYKKFSFSVYYDNNDLLGTVGEPYFEFYIFVNPFSEMTDFGLYDTERFAPDDLERTKTILKNITKLYNELSEKYPEYLV